MIEKLVDDEGFSILQVVKKCRKNFRGWCWKVNGVLVFLFAPWWIVGMGFEKLRLQALCNLQEHFQHCHKKDMSPDVKLWEEKKKYFRGRFQLEDFELQFNRDIVNELKFSSCSWTKSMYTGLGFIGTGRYFFRSLSGQDFLFDVWFVAQNENEFIIRICWGISMNEVGGFFKDDMLG